MHLCRYVREKHEKIEAGLIRQDKKREEARRNMNGLIRAREKLEQLPRSKAITAKLDALAGKLQVIRAWNLLGESCCCCPLVDGSCDEVWVHSPIRRF